MTTMTWEPGTCVHTPAGEIGIVVVTSYRSHLYSHPGDPCINTVDVLIGDTGQVLTYRADRLRPGVSPAGSGPPVPPDAEGEAADMSVLLGVGDPVVVGLPGDGVDRVPEREQGAAGSSSF